MPDDPHDAEVPFEEQPTLRNETPDVAEATPATAQTPGISGAGSHSMGTIGDFEVIDKLGQGDMGAVYRARQVSLGRMVALKILPAQFEEDEEFVSRFQREARLAASLNHPNLVRVYASGLADGSHFIAMELVEGETLSRRVRRGALPMEEAVRICLEVARALQCGWQSAQLIHRDIKPSNIYLSHSGAVKLGDLGLAKSLDSHSTGLTHTGMMMGTPHYISPEQARGERTIDFRTDIYSLGCTLYQCLTGQTPYVGTDPLTVMNLHLSGPPPAILKALPGCPIPLARLVGKMLKKQRHERHQSYEELIQQLESVHTLLETGPIDTGTEARLAKWREVGGGPSATPPPPPRPAPAAGRKSQLPLYGGLAAGFVALGGAVVFLWLKGEKQGNAQPQPPAVVRAAATPLPAKTATVQTPPAAEPWKDVLSDPAKLVLQGKIERTPAGLHFAGGGHAFVAAAAGPKRNGALRVEATFGEMTPFLRARWSHTTGGYYCFVQDAQKIAVCRQDIVSQQTVDLGFFTLSERLRKGSSYELELRAEGQTLTAKLNGQFLGTVEDDTVKEGLFGMATLGSRGEPPTLVKSLEVLDLDGRPEAEALKVAGATANATSPAWQDALAEEPLRAALFHAERDAQGVRLPPGNHWRQSSEIRSGALRVRATHRNPPPNALQLSFVTSEDMHYVPFGGPLQFKLRHKRFTGPPSAFARPGVETTLDERMTTRSPCDGQPHEFLLARIGRRTLVTFDGSLVLQSSDGAVLPGKFSFLLQADLDVRVEKIEYISFDGLPEAEAYRILGLDLAGERAAQSATATKDAPFTNSLGMKFVPVPITGGPTGGRRVLFSIWETRVQDYAAFAMETKREWPKPDFEQRPDHPAVNATWEDAQAFCAWLTERERKANGLGANEAYRLPSDHEWSCAAGIADREDAAKAPKDRDQRREDMFPWNGPWPPPPLPMFGNFGSEELRPLLAAGKYPLTSEPLPGYSDGFAETAPVGTFAPNERGLYDLAGNALEWCEDWIDSTRKDRVRRGGSWSSGYPADVRLSRRHPQNPFVRGPSNGFRVVLAPAP